MTATAADPLTWLRRLVSDVSLIKVDLITAPGGVTEFFASNPPILDPVTVTVDGVPVDPSEYTVTDSSIVFDSAPAAQAQITFRYARTTFSDDELEGYLAVAAEQYDDDLEIVYRAAILALDTVLVGAGTALDVGSGQETLALSSIFNRLTDLRTAWVAELTAQEARPRTFIPAEPPGP